MARELQYSYTRRLSITNLKDGRRRCTSTFENEIFRIIWKLVTFEICDTKSSIFYHVELQYTIEKLSIVQKERDPFFFSLYKAIFESCNLCHIIRFRR